MTIVQNTCHLSVSLQKKEVQAYISSLFSYLHTTNKVNTKTMATVVDIDSTSDFRKKHALSSNALLLTLPDDSSTKNKQSHANHHIELHSHQQEKYQTTPRLVDLHVDDSLLLSYNWQRQSDKVEQLAPAPDIAYRYTYLEKAKRKKSAPMTSVHRFSSSSSRSSSAHSQHSEQQSPRLRTARSSSSNISDSSERKYPQQYRTVYEYILQSLRDIERRRNLKQEQFPTRIKRPLNDDVVLQRVLSAKKYSATPIKLLSISKNDFPNTQNTINYSRGPIRVLHTATSNKLYQ